MEEDLDETVERCASLLMSSDRVELSAGNFLLNSLQAVETLAAERFDRLVQEVAAYRGGSVLRRLLHPVLQGCETASTEEQEAYHTVALASLSVSKVVVERCLRKDGTRAEPETARMVFVKLTHQSVGRARNLPVSRNSRDVASFLIHYKPWAILRSIDETTQISKLVI